MWPDSPNEFTYNLLCATKHCTRETSMALALLVVALKRIPPCQLLEPTA
jgi:hypothetical protein